MYAIAVSGTETFVKDASAELESKGFQKVSEGLYIIQSIQGFDGISQGLKHLRSYKEDRSKNIIYKTKNLMRQS